MNTLGLRSRASIAVAAALVASGAFAGAASAATSGPASSPHPAAYPGAGTMSTAVSPNLVARGPKFADACTPYVDGDHAHLLQRTNRYMVGGTGTPARMRRRR